MSRETRSDGGGNRTLCAAAALIVLTAPAMLPAADGSGTGPAVVALRSGEFARLEADLIASGAATDELERMAAQLGATPRVAGTQGAERAATMIAARMRSWGLRVTVHEYEVWLPHAREVSVERVGRQPRALAVAEIPLQQDPYMDGEHYPVAAGYSAAGDVIAPLVYAKYGRRHDFEKLGRAGVEVSGKIALIHYGSIFHGDKVRNAEEAASADSQFPAARRCWWNRARVARTGLESRGRCRRINGRRAGSAAGAPCRCDRGPIAFCHGAARYICRQKKARRSPRTASLWHAPGHGFEPA
jgi:hypothetical protein